MQRSVILIRKLSQKLNGRCNLKNLQKISQVTFDRNWNSRELQFPPQLGHRFSSKSLCWQQPSIWQGFSSEAKKAAESNEPVEEKVEERVESETEGVVEGTESEQSELEILMARLAEKDAEIEEKDAEIKKLTNGVLTSYAEMENLRDRTKREMEASRKFAVQNFAKDLLDVGDNLSRAVMVVPEELRHKESDAASGEISGKLLKSLLEGVLMTEQQLLKVFKRHGLEKFDPSGNVFDPNVHNALFEISDPTKPPGTVAVVMKAGYKLHDRVIRPAEVGVVKETDS